MSQGRRTSRRQAVFALYQRDLLDLTTEAALERATGPELDAYTRDLVSGTAAEQEAIDRTIQSHLAGWSLERLGIVERSILRLATYELLWEAGVPEAVVIDEAVELAKRFCSDEAGALINGILGSIAGSEGERIRGIRKDQRDSKVAR